MTGSVAEFARLRGWSVGSVRFTSQKLNGPLAGALARANGSYADIARQLSPGAARELQDMLAGELAIYQEAVRLHRAQQAGIRGLNATVAELQRQQSAAASSIAEAPPPLAWCLPPAEIDRRVGHVTARLVRGHDVPSPHVIIFEHAHKAGGTTVVSLARSNARLPIRAKNGRPLAEDGRLIAFWDMAPADAAAYFRRAANGSAAPPSGSTARWPLFLSAENDWPHPWRLLAPDPIAYVLVVRHPVDRLVSLLLWKHRATRPPARRGQPAQMRGLWSLDALSNRSDNYYVRLLSAGACEPSRLQRCALPVALEALRLFSAVLLTERLSESATLLKRTLGWASFPRGVPHEKHSSQHASSRPTEVWRAEAGRRNEVDLAWYQVAHAHGVALLAWAAKANSSPRPQPKLPASTRSVRKEVCSVARGTTQRDGDSRHAERHVGASRTPVARMLASDTNSRKVPDMRGERSRGIPVLMRTALDCRAAHLNRQAWAAARARRMIFLDDASARRFLRRNRPAAAAAWDALRVPAFKADVLRYAWLAEFGGAYADIDLKPMLPFSRLVAAASNSSITLVRDKPANLSRGRPYDYYYNAFISVASAGHPVMEEALRIATDNVLHRRAVHDALSLTGPGVLGQAVFAWRSGQLAGARADAGFSAHGRGCTAKGHYDPGGIGICLGSSHRVLALQPHAAARSTSLAYHAAFRGGSARLFVSAASDAAPRSPPESHAQIGRLAPEMYGACGVAARGSRRLSARQRLSSLTTVHKQRAALSASSRRLSARPRSSSGTAGCRRERGASAEARYKAAREAAEKRRPPPFAAASNRSVVGASRIVLVAVADDPSRAAPLYVLEPRARHLPTPEHSHPRTAGSLRHRGGDGVACSWYRWSRCAARCEGWAS